LACFLYRDGNEIRWYWFDLVSNSAYGAYLGLTPILVDWILAALPDKDQTRDPFSANSPLVHLTLTKGLIEKPGLSSWTKAPAPVRSIFKITTPSTGLN